MAKDERARNWAFLIYPEECFSDWEEKLKGLCVPCAVSPLHTPDDEKKHHHVIVCGDKKSKNQIFNEICKNLGEVFTEDEKEKIKGVTLPQKVLNLRSQIRYLIHFDDKEKQQFEIKDIKTFSGLEVEKYFEDKEGNRYNTIKELINVILEKKFTNILDLLKYCSDENLDDLFQITCNNAYLCTQLCNRYKNEEKTIDKIVKMAL